MLSGQIVPVVVLAGQSNAIVGPVSYGIVDHLRDQSGAFEFVMVTAGGTSLFANDGLDWAPTSTGELAAWLITGIKDAIANVEAQGGIADVSILWMHGEQDIASSSATYLDGLGDFIEAIRTGINQLDAEFIISAIQRDSGPRSAQFAAAATFDNVSVIETRGLATSDGWHYLDEGSYYIADKFLELTNPQAPAAAGYSNILAPTTITETSTAVTIESARFDAFDFTAPDSRNYTVTSWYGPDHVVLGNGNDTIYTFAAADFIDLGGEDDQADAGPGDDIVYGGAGNDTIAAGWNMDLVYGGSGNDIIDLGDHDDTGYGEAGDDILIGGADFDILSGGSGADLFRYLAATHSGASRPDQILDFVSGEDSLDFIGLGPLTFIDTGPFSGSGQIRFEISDGNTLVMANVWGDLSPELVVLLSGVHQLSRDDFSGTLEADQSTIISSKSYSLSRQQFLNLTLRGDGAINGTGNGYANVITGGAGDNILDGGNGADTLIGGTGSDTYIIDNVDDKIVEQDSAGIDAVQSSITFSLAATFLENLTLTGAAAADAAGNAASNVINGNAGNNRIDGGAGADTMAGGGGNDTYTLDHAGDIIIEAANGGIDTVRSSLSYVLGANVENLMLTGSAALNGWGNALGNSLVGNSGNNKLDGAAGADTMSGGLGDDVYIVDNVLDVVQEGSNAGIDLVISSVSFSLAGQFTENLTLVGNANANATGNGLGNRLIGNAGDNRLDGGAGADVLAGGLGNDIYMVDTQADIVQEASGGGIDTVLSTASFSLAGQFIENLTLQGVSSNINGVGNALDNVISGSGGNNTIDGGLGSDAMAGGLGDDTYFVDNYDDTVVEYAGQGTDTVVASVAFSLAGSHVENLTLTGSSTAFANGNELDNRITGNSSNNTLNGRGGNDVLDGGAGADTMNGGHGNDVYYVDNSADIVVEKNLEGEDTIYASVSVGLAGQFVEKLVLTGAGNLNATGNNQANTLQGNLGANRLDGGGGNDSLYGGLGADLLSGGAGADRFYFDTTLGGGNIDSISDYSVVDDTIYLDRTIFSAAGMPGTLAANALAIGAATSAEQRIVYDKASGAVSYDADGSGAAASVQFATLLPGISLTHADFVLF